MGRIGSDASYCPAKLLLFEGKYMHIPEIIRNQFDLVIALDTEYVSEVIVQEPLLGLTTEKIPPYSRKGKNKILSYQCLAMLTHEGMTVEKIFYPDDRLRLSDLPPESSRLFDQGAQIRRRSRRILRVCVVWHWGSAETGALADRKRLMSHEKEVVCIGGGVVSLKPVEYPIDLGGKHYTHVLLTLRDTQRLADEKSSLEALGEAIGIPKVDITLLSAELIREEGDIKQVIR
jgi:hypothetical protein